MFILTMTILFRFWNVSSTHTSVSSHQEALSVRTDGVFNRVSWGCRLHEWRVQRRHRFVQVTEDCLWYDLLAAFILGNSIRLNMCDILLLTGLLNG